MPQEGFNTHVWRLPASKVKARNRYVGRYGRDRLRVIKDRRVEKKFMLHGVHVTPAPRSIYRVSKLYDGLAQYSPQHDPIVQTTDDVRHGISLAYAVFGNNGTRKRFPILPLNLETVDLITSNPSGSAGFTNFGEKKSKSREIALMRAVDILVNAVRPEPCQAFARTQRNDKTRLVWGYPYSMTIIEGIIAYQMNQKFLHSTNPMMFGRPDYEIGSHLRSAANVKKWSYNIDYSKFDSSISRHLIHIAFSIIRTWFDESCYEPTTGVSLDRIFSVIENYFIFTPIVMPDMHLYSGKNHGVPSGSYFTQMVDSIVNVIVVGAISHHFDLNVNAKYIHVLGDDQNFWSDHYVDLNAISRFVKATFGINAHGDEKSSITRYDEPVPFLGRLWTNGHPDQPVEYILQNMLYPEDWRKYSDDEEVADKQCNLLIISYAAVYNSGWMIAKHLLDMRDPRLYSVMIDFLVYDQIANLEAVPDYMMSGYQRYKQKYLDTGFKSGVTSTGLLALL